MYDDVLEKNHTPIIIIIPHRIQNFAEFVKNRKIAIKYIGSYVM